MSPGGFAEDFVYGSERAVLYLAERGIRTISVDYPSVGGFIGDGVETHQALLDSGVWVIEGLNLSGIEPGELICPPLKVEDGDGAPAPAILRR